MKKKRKINIFKIIWISGVFLLLITILLMVMDYKINFEHLTKSNLYFYNCNSSICTSQTNEGIEKSLIYSKYECGYETCPKNKKVLGDSYIILEDNKINMLYDFKNGKIISKEYEDYKLLDDKYIIVTKNNQEGIINIKNKIIIDLVYDQIGYYKDNVLLGYNFPEIIVKKDELYGIVTFKDESIIEKINYKEEEIEDLIKIINS